MSVSAGMLCTLIGGLVVRASTCCRARYKTAAAALYLQQVLCLPDGNAAPAPHVRLQRDHPLALVEILDARANLQIGRLS